MQKRRVSLKFSDPAMADLVAGSTPPDGVTVSKPRLIVQASTPAEILAQVVITFGTRTVLPLVASWLYNSIKNGKAKSGRINRHQITFNEASIRRLIEKEMANQKARDAQRANEQNKPRKPNP